MIRFALATFLTLATAGATTATALRPEEVFSLQGTRLFLDGRPYAEMSFNKFDLLWSIWAAIGERDRTGDDQPLKAAIARQELALRDLHTMGFRTIRIFGTPWSHNADDFAKAFDLKPLIEAIDTTLDLCEQNHIQVVFSLSLGSFALDGEPKVTPGAPAHLIPLYVDPASTQRQHCDAFIDKIVGRYRDRPAIAMWEISNELTNLADIPNRDGRVSPTLPQLAEFMDSAARRIKADDPLRLVSNGGSILRFSAWHLWQHQGWPKDTLDQYCAAYAAYFQRSAVDVIDTHYYELRQGGQPLAHGPDGKSVFLQPSALVDISHAVGKGAIIAEFGTLPSGWESNAKIAPDPGWFVGYHDPNAAGWVQKGVDSLVQAKASLAYWWAYQADRPVDQKSNPVTFSRETTPDLMAIIVDGNKRLKAALGAN